MLWQVGFHAQKTNKLEGIVEAQKLCLSEPPMITIEFMIYWGFKFVRDSTYLVYQSASLTSFNWAFG
jgi:hypothetical protein